MEELNGIRYCVAMKKTRKIFTMTAGGLMILLGSMVVVVAAFFCLFEQDTDFFTFLGIILIPLLFILFGVIGVISAAKKVEVYNGKIIYYIGLKQKAYPMSDIITSKTQTEAYQSGLHYEDIVPVENNDIVTVFYDKAGKKVFRFGLAYDNVDRLKTDVVKTQKRISKKAPG